MLVFLWQFSNIDQSDLHLILLSLKNMTSCLTMSNAWSYIPLDHRYTREIPVFLHRPMYWCHQPWGSNWGSSGFANHIHKNKHNTNASTIFAGHAKTAVDAGDIRTWRTTVILNTGKIQNPQFEPHAGIKMAQVLGSPVYTYDLDSGQWTIFPTTT